MQAKPEKKTPPSKAGARRSAPQASAAGDPGSSVARGALRVQSAAGNQAVGQLLSREAGPLGRRTARAAVGGATAGRFPFGDRIAAETGGRVDPHKVPSVVVDRLPGLGVTYGGKVALRRGSGIEIARHELAHALGANERVADRASRDPGVLGRLGERGGRPVDGWAVGFEFQTTGSDNATLMVPTEDDGWEVAGKGLFGSNDPLYQGPTYKIEQDAHDIEVIVEPPVDETREGRERLSQIMDEVSAHMALIQAGGSGKDGLYTNLDEARRQGLDPDQDMTKYTALPRRRYRSARKAYQEELAKRKDSSDEATEDKGLSSLKSKMDRAKRTLDTARAVQMRRMLKWGIRIRNNPFQAHPQATMGVRYEKVVEMLDRLSTRTFEKDKDDPSRDVGWGDFAQYKGKGRQATQAAITAVRGALVGIAANPAYARLMGLLTQLSMYFHVGQKVSGKLTYVKDLAPFMARTDLIPWVQALSKLERDELVALVAKDDGRLARCFGVGGFGDLLEMKMAPRGAKGDQQMKVANLNPMQILLGLLQDEPTDLIGKNVNEGLHIFGPEKKSRLGTMHDHGDIGRGIDGDRHASGMVGEFRRIRHKVPHTQWKSVALAVFDTTVLVNEGPEALARIRGDDEKKKKKVESSSSLSPPPLPMSPPPLPTGIGAPLPDKAPIPDKAPLPMSGKAPMAPMSGKAPLAPVVPHVPDPNDLAPLRDRLLAYFGDGGQLDRALGALDQAHVTRLRVETAGLATVGRVFASAAEHGMDLRLLARSLRDGGHLWTHLAARSNDEMQLDEATRPMLAGETWNRVVTPTSALFAAYTEDLVTSTAFLSQTEGHTLARQWNAYARVFNRERVPVNGMYVDPFTGRRYREVVETEADGHCLIHGLNIIINGVNADDERVRQARRTIRDNLQLNDLRQQLIDMIWQYIDTGYVPGLGARTRAVLEADTSVQAARTHALLAQALGKLGDKSDPTDGKGKPPESKEKSKEKSPDKSPDKAPESSSDKMARQDVSALTLAGYGVIVPSLSYGETTAPQGRQGILVFVNDSHYIVVEPVEDDVEAPGPDEMEQDGSDHESVSSEPKSPPPEVKSPKPKPMPIISEKTRKKERREKLSKSKAPPRVGRLRRMVASRDVKREATRRQLEHIVRVYMPRSVFSDPHDRGEFVIEWVARARRDFATLIQAAEAERWAGKNTSKLADRIRRAIHLAHPD